jgi:hypothetical protein
MDEAWQFANITGQRSETLEEWSHLHLGRVEAKQGEVHYDRVLVQYSDYKNIYPNTVRA